MIVRDLTTAEKSGRRIVSPDGNWESVRLLLKEDNVGFSFHITTIYRGRRLSHALSESPGIRVLSIGQRVKSKL